MKKAIQYVRISTSEQSNWSLSGQRETNNRFAEKNNIKIFATFEDNGKSAKDFKREGWRKLESFLKANHTEIDFVLVAKYDRVIRNAAEGLRKIEQLEQRYNVRVLSVTENIAIDPQSPFFFKMRADMLVNAHFELLVIKDRTKAGVYQAKSEGRFIGQAPFGYKNARDAQNKPIVIKDESKRLVFDYLEKSFFKLGENFAHIQEGVKKLGFSRKGNEALRRMLENPVYYGLIEVPAYRQNPSKIIQAKHKGWFSEHYYRQAIDYFSSKNRKREILSEEIPLRGVLRCDNCGAKLTGGRSKGRNQYYNYYRCLPKSGCNANYSAELAHSQLEGILQQLSLDPSLANALGQAIKQEYSKQQESNEQRNKKLQSEIRDLTNRINSLEEKYIADKIEDVTFKKWQGIYTRDLMGKKTEVAQIKQSLSVDWQKITDNTHLLQDLRWLYQKADVSQKQLFVSNIFYPYLWRAKDGYRTEKINDLLFYNGQIINGLLIESKRENYPKNGNSPVSTRNVVTIEPLINIIMDIAA